MIRLFFITIFSVITFGKFLGPGRRIYVDVIARRAYLTLRFPYVKKKRERGIKRNAPGPRMKILFALSLLRDLSVGTILFLYLCTREREKDR